MALAPIRHGKKSPLIKLVGINARYTHSCLALFYLRHALARHVPDARTEMCQYTINDNQYEVMLDIAREQPEAVLLSAAIWNSEMIRRLVTDLHTCLPLCRIVVGGPQARALRRQLDSSCCSMVYGAIERVPLNFYKDLVEGALAPDYECEAVDGIESFPYPYRDEDFASHLKNRLVYYESSRGCPYSCSYCLSASDRRVVRKDVATVRDEVGHILQFHPKELRFVDRTFNDNPKRALALWQMLLEFDCATRFHFEIAPERFDEDMFAFLATVPVGRFQFEIGIQSTHAKTLEAINRKVDTSRLAEIIQRLAQLQTIYLHVDLILGLPYETKDIFLQSFVDIFAMGAQYIQMGLLKILPDTPISRQVEQYGYRHMKEPPYSVMANSWIAQEEFAERYWLCECAERFLNSRNFVSIWQYFRKMGEDIADFFVSLTAHCLKNGFFQRASTQELLCQMLVEVFWGRKDREVLIDLLRFDWLRTGNRNLPDSLQLDQSRESMQDTKDMLYQVMPESVDPWYMGRDRNRFFKRIWCIRLSPDAVHQLGLFAAHDGRICFLPEVDNSLYRFQQVFLPEQLNITREIG